MYYILNFEIILIYLRNYTPPNAWAIFADQEYIADAGKRFSSVFGNLDMARLMPLDAYTLYTQVSGRIE